MRSAVRLTLSVVLLFTLATAAQAQPGGGRGGFGGGGFGGTSRLQLLQIEAVQKELGLTEDQIASIKKLRDELRPMGGGRGGQGGRGGNGQRGQRPANPDVRVDGPDRFYVQAQGQRPQPSEEDIKKFREAAQERAKKEREEIAKILKPEQAKRLLEIFIQQAGTAALSDADVAKAVGISDEQKEKMDKIRQESMAGMRDLFGGGAGGGDREAARAKLADLRKSTDEKVLAVLSDDQKKKFEDLKGKKFDMPEQPRGGGRTGRGGGNAPQN